jgi:hypothetical protein
MLIDMNRSWHRLTQRSVMPTDVALRLKGHAEAYQQPGCLDRKCTTNRADSIVSARDCIRVFYVHKRLPNTWASGVSPFNPGARRQRVRGLGGTVTGPVDSSRE